MNNLAKKEVLESGITESCPFRCVSYPELNQRLVAPGEFRYWVECEYCHARGPSGDSPKMAVEFWNDRSSD